MKALFFLIQKERKKSDKVNSIKETKKEKKAPEKEDEKKSKQ